MMRNKFLRTTVFLGLSSSLTFGINAHHNGSRYFPFLEKSQDIVVKKHSNLTPEFFYLKASTAHKRGGGNYGIPELWGNYDLNDVIKSIGSVKGASVATNLRNQLPINLQGTQGDGVSIPFSMGESINVEGFALGFESCTGLWHKKPNGLSAGFWIPIMHASGLGVFNPSVDSNGSISGDGLIDPITGDPTSDGLMVDKVRRDTHDTLGFIGNVWDASGLGDLDIHVRWNYFIDHQCLMRSIDSYIQVGYIIPIGMKLKINEPLSVPAMGNGHEGLYLDALAEFELKQDWKFGFNFGGLYQINDIQNRRLPVGSEPVVYSALSGRVKVQPGFTNKVSPYFTLENLTDGVHFQVRYTYLHHGLDKWYDKRSQVDQTSIPSYLSPNNTVFATSEAQAQNIRNREVLSKWVSHFFTFQLAYDAKQALKKIGMDPLLCVTYDLPISGSSIAKTHQLSLSVQLHF